MSFFNSHISTEQFADVIDKTSAQTAGFQTHLANCEHCAREFSALEQVIGLMKNDDSRAAPAAAFNFALDLFRARKPLIEPRATITEKIIANLQIDLSKFTFAFAERSAAVNQERQLIISAGDFDLDLRARKISGGFAVRGQILGELTGRYLIRIRTAEFTGETAANELGEFAFELVPTLENVEVSLISR